MPINFPDSPTTGDTHTVGDKTWTYDGTAWNVVQNNISDHGNLDGLADDDHTQYALADGSRGTFETSGAVSTHEAASDPHTQYLLADGTRTATELTVSGDLTVDTSTLHVDATNNRVGIGTTSPSQALDVNGDIVMPVGNGIMFDRSGSDVHVLYKETPGSSTYGAGDDVILRNPNGARVRFQTNGTNDRMVITNTGNVGIGTASPSVNLHISSGTAGDAELRIEADTDNNDEGDQPFIALVADGGIVEGAIGLNNNTLVLANSVTSDGGIDFRTGTTNYYTNAADVQLNTTSRMLIDSSGHVTMPHQPCFYAYRSGGNMFFGSGWSVVQYNAELFDNNGDFNTSNYRFVAPVTGKYQFNTTVSAYNIDVSQNATQLVVSLYKNGVEHTRLYQRGQYTTVTQDRNTSGSAVISMSANDYVEVRVYSTDTGWALSATQIWNSFSGFLIG